MDEEVNWRSVLQSMWTIGECIAVLLAMHMMFKEANKGDWITFWVLTWFVFVYVFGIATYVACKFKGDYLTIEDDLL